MATKKAITKKTVAKKAVKKTALADTAALMADVYTAQGKKHGQVALPNEIFALPWNGSLVQQVVVGMQANARTPVAHTKTRGEVRGGGKKPWKQKGTGRARHGSIRSPIWVGGGITHGPRNDKDYSKKINKKMRVKALYTALAEKMRMGGILFVDTLSFATPKTAEAKKVMTALSGVKGFDKLSTKNKNAALIVLSGKDAAVAKSFANFGNVTTVEAKDVNPVAVLGHEYIMVVNPEASLKVLSARGDK
ncbi:50S ribosomal protein L4 [Candidatus Kaiserbacteria bacterium]|nr:50S ribosomal protein L4 [Candidatus Kaiserbacteria bacterium]